MISLRCFPVNFVKFYRPDIFKKASGGVPPGFPASKKK